MFESVQGLLDEHDSIQAQLGDPAVYADQRLARKLGRRSAQLNGIVEAYHAAFACDLKRDFGESRAPPIATEFCATSITTRGRSQDAIDAILRDNPHIHFGDAAHRGYVVLDVTAASCIVRLQAVQDPTDRRTGVFTAATFRVDAGRPGAHRI